MSGSKTRPRSRNRAICEHMPGQVNPYCEEAVTDMPRMAIPSVRRRWILVPLLALGLLAGCGGGREDSTPTAQTTPPQVSATPIAPGDPLPPDPKPTRVRVQIIGGPTIGCGNKDERPCPVDWTPTTFLPSTGVCTEQYGGPERARAKGVVDGTVVDAALDRSNGCTIAQWAQIVDPLRVRTP